MQPLHHLPREVDTADHRIGVIYFNWRKPAPTPLTESEAGLNDANDQNNGDLPLVECWRSMKSVFSNERKMFYVIFE